MANPEHVAKLKEGVKAWNAWRKRFRGTPDLRGLYFAPEWEWGERVNLCGINLSDVILHEVDFSGADLTSANLTHATFEFADLDGVNLQKANCHNTCFYLTDLQGADLRDASLNRVTFSQTRLARALIGGAFVSNAIFSDTRLAGVVGLDDCKHGGPSSIDFRTLALSGRLPLPFLRGCGLPDTYIEYLPSLLQQVIQFYSCFISYSTKDQPFADRLHADLQDKGVRCWFAPHKMQAGKKLHDQIDEAIRIYDRLLLILSEHSMNSEWVKTEIAKARQKEITQRRQVLFPITLVPFDVVRQWSCFDADTGKDSAREIREYFIPDFSQWKQHDAYQKAFDRLLKHLQTEAPNGA